MAVEDSGPGGGGGVPPTVAGIPTKYAVIGAGGILLAFFFLNRSKAPVSPRNADSVDVATGDTVYGQALGPNAALALGSLQTELMQQSGKLQGQAQGYYEDITKAIADQGVSFGSSLQAHYDAQAAHLSDIGASLGGQIQGVQQQVVAGNILTGQGIARQDQWGSRIEDILGSDVVRRLKDLQGIPEPGGDWIEQARARMNRAA
jgi:hypothetical protein